MYISLFVKKNNNDDEEIINKLKSQIDIHGKC